MFNPKVLRNKRGKNKEASTFLQTFNYKPFPAFPGGTVLTTISSYFKGPVSPDDYFYFGLKDRLSGSKIGF
jgi:hypothetical protein